MNTENAFRAAGCLVLTALVSFALYTGGDVDTQVNDLTSDASVELATDETIL